MSIQNDTNNTNTRESSSLLYIRKVVQLDYPDNVLKSTKLTGPGHDIGRQAGRQLYQLCKVEVGESHLR